MGWRLDLINNALRNMFITVVTAMPWISGTKFGLTLGPGLGGRIAQQMENGDGLMGANGL